MWENALLLVKLLALLVDVQHLLFRLLSKFSGLNTGKIFLIRISKPVEC